jgi:hypothetical protein
VKCQKPICKKTGNKVDIWEEARASDQGRDPPRCPTVPQSMAASQDSVVQSILEFEKILQVFY